MRYNLSKTLGGNLHCNQNNRKRAFSIEKLISSRKIIRRNQVCFVLISRVLNSISEILTKKKKREVRQNWQATLIAHEYFQQDTSVFGKNCRPRCGMWMRKLKKNKKSKCHFSVMNKWQISEITENTISREIWVNPNCIQIMNHFRFYLEKMPL